MNVLQIGSGYGDYPANAGVGAGAVILWILIFLFFGYCMYRLFQKAGIENAWMGFIPILNYIPLMQMAKKPTWWVILLFIPLVNIVIAVNVWMRVSKAFGKSDLFGIAMIFLSFILLPMLAFGSAQYNPNALPDETNKAF